MSLDIEAVARSDPQPYEPTYSFDGPLINNTHERLLHAPLDGAKIIYDIPGSLRREDAAKLYELAYFAQGPVIDLGTNKGLSAYIMANAIKESGRHDFVDTIDLNEFQLQIARKNMLKYKIDNVRFHHADAAEWLSRQPGIYGFCFVDHAHTFDLVRNAVAVMDKVLRTGSYVAFHDFIDHRNFDDTQPDYGVAQAVIDGLPKSFTFHGGCGCMGIFRYMP